MKTTLYEIGQFPKHDAAVTSGVFIGNQFIEIERVKTFANSMRELCAKALSRDWKRSWVVNCAYWKAGSFLPRVHQHVTACTID